MVRNFHMVSTMYMVVQTEPEDEHRQKYLNYKSIRTEMESLRMP